MPVDGFGNVVDELAASAGVDRLAHARFAKQVAHGLRRTGAQLRGVLNFLCQRDTLDLGRRWRGRLRGAHWFGRDRQRCIRALHHIDERMLHAGLPHLAQGTVVRDQEAIAPEGMVEPVPFEGMQVHPDTQLTDGDFLQHEPVHFQGRSGRQCIDGDFAANDTVHIR